MGTWVARLRALGWKRWLSATVVVLVVVGGLGAWLLTRSGGDAQAQTTTATVSSGTIKQTVSATGTIEAKHTADLDFAVSGTVTKVYVKAGDTVSKGQALAKVADGALVATRDAAAASVTAAQEQLVDDEDADASDVQLAADRTAVLSAQATLKSAREDVDDAVLRATVAGTVTAVNVAKGDAVGGSTGSSGSGSTGSSSTTGSTGSSSSSSSSTSTSSSAFEIVSTNRFIVDATVSADDVKQLKKGLQTEITVTGVDDTVYGTVATIGLVAQTSSSGAAVFPVTIDVTGTRKDLYAGTSATASIIVKQTTGVLSVTSSAIHTDADGSTYVEKVVDGNAVKTPVEIGTVYGPTTQIVSGLSEGDVVQVEGFTRGATSGGSSGGGEGGGYGGGSFPGGGSMPGGMPGGAGFGG